MLGNKQRMPKRARYPMFIVGLAILLIGSLAANSVGATAPLVAVIAMVGFAFMVLSVAIR